MMGHHQPAAVMILEHVGHERILDHKNHGEPSVFDPTACCAKPVVKSISTVQDVPAVCILDPDGDVVRHLKASGKARRFASWPCYHTELHTFELAGDDVGIVVVRRWRPICRPCCRGAVLHAPDAAFSPTSPGGQIDAVAAPPYFVVIDRALRDEGTSYHYVAPSEFAEADPRLVAIAMEAVAREGLRVFAGASWTTDALLRETTEAIESARARGVLAVEMEAAALYAFAQARDASVLCLAHVTNAMERNSAGFRKG